MDKNLIIKIGLPVVVIILAIGIIVGHSNESYKQDISYKEYEQSERDNYLSFKANILKELKSQMNIGEAGTWQQDYNAHLQMTSNQFEGPQVHLEKLIYNHKEYIRDTVNKYRNKYKEFLTPFTIHELQFDPDERTTGKPDIIVTVVPPVPFQERRSAVLQGILNRIDGAKDKISPYKTYSKEVYKIEDSIIKIEHIKMDLWLTKFNVTITTDSWGKYREDSADGKREIANQRHAPFDVLLKILPNVSPWYVNDGKSFDKKPDMAIGAIYCDGIQKDPKDSRNIGVVPRSIGEALPLIKQSYYNQIDNASAMFDQEANDQTIWNKPLYAYISVPEIGSYRELKKKGDEMVNFSFIMPLLVRGSWDVQIPSSIVPEYKPTPPYKRTLSDIFLPKWGLGKFGKVLSGFFFLLVIAAIGFSVLKNLMPF